MTKFVAKLGLFLVATALVFANYWFTFGLWPKSWVSFFLCTAGHILLLALSMAVDKDGKS